MVTAAVGSEPKRSLRVLVVDDSEPVRATVRQMVGLCGDGVFEVVGEAADGPAAVSLAIDLKPDAILMDINLPGCDGITAAARIHEAVPSRIVMVSVENGREYFRRAMQVGAVDYLVKPFTPEGLAEALRGVESAADDAPVVDEPAVTATRSQLIAVCGAKGGVGTSTVALNLSLAFGHHLSTPAALCDLDPDGGLIGIMAGAGASGRGAGAAVTLADGAATLVPETGLGRARFECGAVVCDIGRGMRLPDDVKRALCWTDGMEPAPPMAEALDAPFGGQDEARLLLVVTGEVVALHAAARLLKGPLAGLPRERVCLVVNRVGRSGAIRPDEVARTLALPTWTPLPEEGTAVEAANLGRPLLQHRSRSPFAAAMERLVRRLADEAPPA